MSDTPGKESAEELANRLTGGWTGILETAYGLDPCPAIKIAQNTVRWDELVALLKARDAAVRREALEEACKAMCKLCRDGRPANNFGGDWTHGWIDDVKIRTFDGREISGPAMCDSKCEAAPIRALMEEPK